MTVMTSAAGAGNKNVFQVLSTEPMTDRNTYPEGTVKLTFRSAVDGKTDWALFTPGDSSKNIIVYMHGSFSHADQIYTRMDVRTFWLSRILKGNHPLLSVNLRDTTYMSPATTKDLTDLLTYCCKHLNCKNYVLLGGSGGASSAMAYAVVHPEMLHGVIAMGMCDLIKRLDFAKKSEHEVLQRLARIVFESYGGSLEEKPELYEERSVLKHADKLTMPLVLTMGEADPLIPVEETRKIAEAMKGKSNFTYVEVSGGNHDSAIWIDIDLQTLKVINPKSVHPLIKQAKSQKTEDTPQLAAYLDERNSNGGVFFTTATPVIKNHKVGNKKPVIGLQFTPSQSIDLKAIKFYQAKGETGEHLFSIWKGETCMLDISTPATTQEGWNTFMLPTALKLDPKTTYTISVPVHKAYAATKEFKWPVKQQAVTAMQGVYCDDPQTCPVKSYKNLNYFIDVIW